MRITFLVLVFLTAGRLGSAVAQSAPVPFASIKIEPFEPEARADRTLALPSREAHSQVVKKKDHTAAGILIGAGLGLAAGYALYNGLCEAVDNQCSDSRVRLLVMGGVVGAAIGGLIGSLSQ